MKVKVLKGVYLPIVFELHDDSNHSNPEYREFAPFFANGYLEWPFEIKYQTCTGLIEIYDEANARIIEYSLVEVNYLPQKRSNDPDYPYVHSFKELERFPLNAIKACKVSARFCEVDPNFINVEPDDYISETKIIDHIKKIL